MEFILYPERPLLNIDYLSGFTEGAFLRFKEYTDELVYGTPRGEHITDLQNDFQCQSLHNIQLD